MGKRLIAAALCFVLALLPARGALGDEIDVDLKLDEDFPAVPVISLSADSVPARAAILMDQQSGRVLYEQNADEALPPASITKVMTLLLIMEALEDGRISINDRVTASELASSMGGSQIWLKAGEVMTVDELLRAVAIASANDASVALGEHVAGTEAAFIDRMNVRARELGLQNTVFKNCTGLDEAGHVTTARDVAIVSRELMRHPEISEYSTIWMDELRGGDTQLVNTNKLVRFYPGTTGLKTGTTGIAGSCLSATATRDGLSLIAVVLGAPNSDSRFSGARGLLDYGFAGYMSVVPPAIDSRLTPVKVLHGVADSVMPVYASPGTVVIEKELEDQIEQVINLVEDVQAPVVMGQLLGNVEILVGGSVVSSYPLRAAADVEEMSFLRAFATLGKALLTLGANSV